MQTLAYNPRMRFLLWQPLTSGVIHIAIAPDGRFHVLWLGESLASAESIGKALQRSGEGNFVLPSTQQRLERLQVSPDPGRWLLAGQGRAASALPEAQPDAQPEWARVLQFATTPRRGPIVSARTQAPHGRPPRLSREAPARSMVAAESS